MIEIDLDAQRGALHLQIKCKLSAPWTVLFGPSGAGKTTLLRLIAGLEKPSHGRVVIDPKPSLGMVSQRSALFPHLSARQNISYGIAHLPPKAQQERASQMLDLVDASELTDRLPLKLSGGEAQRISLARSLAPLLAHSLASGPQLLLLDEPLSALDGEARDLLLSRLQLWLRDREIQTVLVTHDAADAIATEAEVLVLDQGKLIAQGPATEVLASARNRLLTRLLNSHPEPSNRSPSD